MSGLESLDLALFRFINLKLSNPVFDLFMPQLSSNAWFIPLLLALAFVLLWKGGTRGRLFVIVLALVLALGDTFVINRIKKVVARPRPFMAVPEAHLPVGRGSSGSMPSSHTSTWCAAALIAYVYFRRSWRVLVPLAALIGFSRVYLGVHYPSDVLAGALLGAGYAIAGLWLLEALWRFVGRRWFPIWWQRVPSLVPSPARAAPATQPATSLGDASRGQIASVGGPTPTPRAGREQAETEKLAGQQWLHLGYAVIALLLVGRLLYLASGRIELSEDEAYQWLWSKHLALSYYSKPPMIAWLHWLGTAIWGDTVFGIRFCPPVISAVASVVLLRFLAREISPRSAFWIVLASAVVPLLAAGSILMTIDPPLVLFWCAAMCAGWRAVQSQGTTADWMWMGVWVALGFLSKYTALLFFPCLVVYFILQPAARVHLRRPGPWLALVPLLVAVLPVAIWNAQHGWVTLQHVSENAKLDKPWQPTPRFLAEFIIGEAGLLNPAFFLAVLVACVGFWRHARQRPLELYLLAVGAPVFVGYGLYTLHSRVQLNWIAPSVIPLLAFGFLYWEQRWRQGRRWVATAFLWTLGLSAPLIIVMHDTDLLNRVAKVTLPAKLDPLRRVRAISEMAEVVGQARHQLQVSDGQETFIIAPHYGLTGQLTFYLPEARAGLPGMPLVYVRTTAGPKNQFYFWPEYRYPETRRGQNAIYVAFNDRVAPPPREVAEQFESVTDLGLREIRYGNRVFHTIQLYACRHLR